MIGEKRRGEAETLPEILQSFSGREQKEQPNAH